MRITGGTALVGALLAEGVETIFGLPGIQNDWFFNALFDARDRIRVVHTRHEQGAAYMALGYAMARGGIGVYNVVPGPGVLNTTAALATAYALNAQVLCLAGQIPLAAIGRDGGVLHAVRQIGFKVSAEENLDGLEQMAQRPGLAAARRQEPERPSVLTLEDPFGLPLAFYFASVKHPWLLQQYHHRRCPSIQRIDHVNVFAASPGAALAWYRDALGFRLTEYTEDDAGNVWAAWLHRKGNVHDVAFTNGAGPRLHHVAFWMPDAAQVLQLCDVLGASRTGVIERGPGRHGISNALYLYLRDPDGHRVEIYTSDYLTVDPDFEPIKWPLDDPYRQQLWGGLAPKSWFTEGSACRRADGSLHPLAQPALEGLPRYIS